MVYFSLYFIHFICIVYSTFVLDNFHLQDLQDVIGISYFTVEIVSVNFIN